MAGNPLLLATGATGLVTSHVVREWLVAHPEGRAISLDLTPLDPVVTAFFAPVAERLTFRQGDICDPALWQDLAEHPRITHVVHGAVVTSINRLTARPDGSADLAPALPALEANILGTARLLAWAQRLPALQRLIYISSGSVYAPEGPDPLPEDGYVVPSGLYPISKHTAELLTRQVAGQFGLPAFSVRLSGVYGPLDRETTTRSVRSVAFTLLRHALDGRAIGLAGLDGVGDYLHAGDIGRAITALLDCPAPRHEVYNIAYGEAVTLRHLADLVAALVPGAGWHEAAPEQADLSVDPNLSRGRYGAYDITRVTGDTDWRPRPLAEAFADYRDWLTQHPY